MPPRLQAEHIALFIIVLIVLIGWFFKWYDIYKDHFLLAYYVEAQALNDPITQYIEGRLGNRRIFWCPSGYGYLAYCPQPTGKN
jgi:hypothetical protein